MAIGKDEVVEVLSDMRIRSIRFTAGPIPVNVEEYDRVSDFVGSGAVEIKPTKSFNNYVPKINTIYLKDGDPINDFNVRSGILHECTHVIADINKAAVFRMHDEAAAYLAQLAFWKLLEPSYSPVTILGDPLGDILRKSLKLVDQYGLGQPAGFGAIISQSDIETLGKLVHRHPQYSTIPETEQLDADGVALNEDQMALHFANKAARTAERAKYEGWLLGTVVKLAASGPGQKSLPYQALFQHFFMVFLPEATILLHRLSSVKKGDALSEAFDKLTAQQKYDLLEALRVPKPPG
jgi:hypothetical protein